METNQTEDEPTPPTSGEQAPEITEPPAASAPAEPHEEATPEEAAPEAGPSGEVDPLADLVARSQAARLPVADEERMGALLKEALLSGKAGIAKAVENLPKLPWIVGVRAVEAAWPELKATPRAQVLKGLADDTSEGARRIRLSLARGLWKQDLPTAIKLALGVCKEMKEKETGLLSQRNSQIFTNVFIGKVKPWLAQLPLADLKPADADSLVHCAIIAAFSLPHPPVTQLGILKWAGAAGRLEKLHEGALEVVTKNVSRWSAKWQSALLKEVTGLPEAITSVLKPAETAASSETVAAEPIRSEDGASDAVTDSPESEVAQEPKAKQRPVYEPRPQRPAAPVAASPEPSRDREPEREGKDRDRENEREGRRGRGRDPRGERPVYQPRGASGGSNFNLSETLRQIETHVQSLRSDLSAAQFKLSQREEEPRPIRRTVERGPIIPGEQSPEELARLNLQLEARINELQLRIGDLLHDAEDRAASMGAHGEQPETDPNQQLRTLLGFKLQEDFADYYALENESTSVVVQQHYRSLLGHIFEVLAQEGIALKREA